MTVVSFSAFVNDRRAAAETARREIAAADRAAADKARLAAEVTADLGGSPAAAVLGALVAEVAMDPRNTKPAPAYVPAYCDPANEVRGSKYDATRGLGSTEIAARIRADIKEAQKAGRIPTGCKISVRKDSYSGGYSIDVRVTALPEGFRVTTPRFASWIKQFDDALRCPMAWQDCQSEESRTLIASLESIRRAYNRDNSDGMSDYFDVRYYGDTTIDWCLRDDLTAAEAAASPGDVWAPECGA